MVYVICVSKGNTCLLAGEVARGVTSIADGRRHNITLVNVDEQDQVYLVVDGYVEDMKRLSKDITAKHGRITKVHLGLPFQFSLLEVYKRLGM